MTKGDVLKDLLKKLTLFKVPDLITFSCDEWEKNQTKLIKRITNELSSDLLIVRSSAIGEDSDDHSMAGQFDSILNVKKNKNDISKAVKAVTESYLKKNKYNELNKIIVQNQISDVLMSGVIFTRELNTGSPYYVINYDDKSGLTNSVTSGVGKYSNRTIYVLRNVSLSEISSERFKILIEAIRELEYILNTELLDIEFAITKELVPCLFQVRKITSNVNWGKNKDKEVYDSTDSSSLFFKRFLGKEKFILGESSVLSQMSDWNPVEMIGKHPSNLDFSLYNKLITQKSWSKARSIMGYYNITGKPLMVSICGQPYIDTRLSFNSLLPKSINSKIGDKLVNHWIKKLTENPFLHDKIEFDVAITSYSFDLENLLDNEYSFLNNNEKEKIVSVYKEFTIRQIQNKSKGSISEAISNINKLDDILNEDFGEADKITLNEINLLIEKIIKYGIVPFSIIARHAFISKNLLDTLNGRYNIFSKEEVQRIYESIPTIASEFSRDSYLFSKNKIPKKSFFKKYGHLRPGTYDITSLRYDQMDSKLFKRYNNEVLKIKKISFESKTKRKIESVFVKHGFDSINFDQFMKYIEDSIKYREYAKFIFTKGVSLVLETIANSLGEYDLNREDISNLSIDEIIQFHHESHGNDLITHINSIINKRKENLNLSHLIRLPQVICKISDLKIIPFQVSSPNFITNNKIESEVIYLDNKINLEYIENKVVLIENADPGFDFIFNYKINGLITKYGGANSHMAIRCAEFNLSAAIGCGEQIFESLLNYNGRIKLDCAKKQIIKLI